MKRILARSILITVCLTTLGCTRTKHGPKVTGEFTRFAAQMSQGGMTLPELPEAALSGFPSVVRFDGDNGFQVDAAAFEMHGRYRLKGDSIFLDSQEGGDSTRLAFSGRLYRDTLQLRWIPDYDVGSGSTEAEWQLFFARSR